MCQLFEQLTLLNNINLNLKLPLVIDQEKLLTDFQNVYSRFIESPQSGSYNDGGWKAIGLITSGGDFREDRPKFIVGKPFLPSSAMEFCPYLKEFLDKLPAIKK